MIYSIYEKIIEITENYKAFDYLTYFIFVLFVLFSSTAAVVYATGDFSLTSSNLIYTVTADEHDGHIKLPALDVSCDSDDGLSLSIDVNVSGYNPSDVLDLSITEGNSDNSKHFLIRLPDSGNPQTINYGQDLKEWSSLFTILGYETQWNLSMHGEFKQGMVIDFSNLNAYSKEGKCSLTWNIKTQSK